MFKQLVVIACLAASSAAMAENKDKWFVIGDTQTQTLYANTAKIEAVSGSETQELDMWWKSINKVNNDMGKKGSYLLVLYRLKCIDKQYKTLKVVQYSKAGAKIAEDVRAEEYEATSAGSLMDQASTALCEAVFSSNPAR